MSGTWVVKEYPRRRTEDRFCENRMCANQAHVESMSMPAETKVAQSLS